MSIFNPIFNEWRFLQNLDDGNKYRPENQTPKFNNIFLKINILDSDLI